MESDPAATITGDAGMIDLAENTLFSSAVIEANPRIAKCAFRSGGGKVPLALPESQQCFSGTAVVFGRDKPCFKELMKALQVLSLIHI